MRGPIAIIRTRKSLSSSMRPPRSQALLEGTGRGGHTSGTRAVMLSVPHLAPSLQMLPKAPGAQQARGTFASARGKALSTGKGEERGPDTHKAHDLCLLLQQDFPLSSLGLPALGSSPAPPPVATVQVAHFSGSGN